MKHLQRPEFLMLALALILAAWAGGYPLMDAMAWTGGLSVLNGSAEAARTLRLLLGILIFVPLALHLLRSRAVILPKLDAQAALAVLLVGLAFPIAASPFPWASVDGWLSWCLYGGAFLLAVAAAGRKEGPLILLAALTAGAAATALHGIQEYAAVREVEPTYRIFAGWSNPNAVASLFVASLPVALAVSGRDRLWTRILGAAASALILSALLLTQSKGGFLAAGVSLASLALLAAVWRAPKTAWIGPAVGLVLGGLLFVGIQNAPRAKGAPGGASMARLASGGEAEQSAGFRTLLWKSSIELAKERPMGWGPGVFRFVSGKPGLVTQTVTAHQAFLQILVDGGFLALAGFLLFAFTWLRRVFAGARSMTSEQNLLRAGVVAAILGAGAHGMVESSLSYAGMGVIFFALLGIGLQLSADGSSPEIVPLGLRRMAALMACFGPLLLLGASSWLEREKGEILAKAEAGVPASSAPALAFLDGEASYVQAIAMPPGPAQLELLKTAEARHPSTKVLRTLARAQMGAGDFPGALTSLSQAVETDPNNLQAMWLKVQASIRSGNEEEARASARDLIAREKSSAFQVRSLAESVPTETYRARLWLAAQTPEPEKTRLIEEAAKGFAEFARLTVPVAVRFAKGGQVYPGAPIKDCIDRLTEALEAARSVPKPSQGLTESVSAIEAGLEALRSVSS